MSSEQQLTSVLRRLKRAVETPAEQALDDARLLDRFVRQRDEDAFELLVWRHERLVMGVCRRVLRDVHDAEDAFQATFLALVRKARSISRRQALAGWLYTVAYRIAVRAGNRRERAEQTGALLDALDAGTPDPAVEAAWRDLEPFLDREVDALPTKYRVPIVLCYLEGKTYSEAAEQLGCPKGTLSARLTRARELLRSRLERRGVTLSAAALATLLCEHAATAGTPTLVQQTVAAAAAWTAGNTTVVSAQAASLATFAVHALFWTKVKAWLAVTAGLIVCAGLSVWIYHVYASSRDESGTVDQQASTPAIKADEKPVHGMHEAKADIPAMDWANLWTLGFRFLEPRTLEADGKTHWYLRYEIVNNTGRPRSFVPVFELVVPKERRGALDQVLPARIDDIRKLHEPDKERELHSSVSIAAKPIAPTKGDNRPVAGVAIWDEVSGNVKGFTIFVRGLSNETDSTGPQPLHKTLQLDFKHDGKDMKFVAPPRWVFLPRPPSETTRNAVNAYRAELDKFELVIYPPRQTHLAPRVILSTQTDKVPRAIGLVAFKITADQAGRLVDVLAQQGYFDRARGFRRPVPDRIDNSLFRGVVVQSPSGPFFLEARWNKQTHDLLAALRKELDVKAAEPLDDLLKSFADPSRFWGEKTAETVIALKKGLDLSWIEFRQRAKPGEKAQPAVILSIRPMEDPPPNAKVVVIDMTQMAKILDQLATDGFLGRAEEQEAKKEEAPPEPLPALVVHFDTGFRAYVDNLGWGPSVPIRLEAVRDVLAGDAARALDDLLAWLNGPGRF